jgi:hypothetical protein
VAHPTRNPAVAIEESHKKSRRVIFRFSIIEKDLLDMFSPLILGINEVLQIKKYLMENEISRQYPKKIPPHFNLLALIFNVGPS